MTIETFLCTMSQSTTDEPARLLLRFWIPHHEKVFPEKNMLPSYRKDTNGDRDPRHTQTLTHTNTIEKNTWASVKPAGSRKLCPGKKENDEANSLRKSSVLQAGLLFLLQIYVQKKKCIHAYLYHYHIS